MTLQIEEGKWYQRADGSPHGPAHRRYTGGGTYPWDVGGNFYTNDGHFYSDQPAHSYDLVRELPVWAGEVEKEVAEERYPDNNPKTAYGRVKAPLHAIPPSALLHLGLAMEDGERKYGLFNWREKQVSASVYFDAAQRHLLAWWDGESHAEDSGVHHLAHVMACCAILIDAAETGRLNDDRGPAGTFAALAERIRAERANTIPKSP